MTHKPGPDTEVERGEHQGEVEVVPGGQWMEELEEPGERRTVRLQPGQSQTAHTDEDQQGKYKLKLNVNKNRLGKMGLFLYLEHLYRFLI